MTKITIKDIENKSIKEIYDIVYENTLFKIVLEKDAKLENDTRENKIRILQYANPDILSKTIIDLLVYTYENRIINIIGFYAKDNSISFRLAVEMFMRFFNEHDCGNDYLELKLKKLSPKFNKSKLPVSKYEMAEMYGLTTMKRFV